MDTDSSGLGVARRALTGWTSVSRRASRPANCRCNYPTTPACEAEGNLSERAWLFASTHINGSVGEKSRFSADAVTFLIVVPRHFLSLTCRARHAKHTNNGTTSRVQPGFLATGEVKCLFILAEEVVVGLAGIPIKARTGSCTPLPADSGSRVGCLVDTEIRKGIFQDSLFPI